MILNYKYLSFQVFVSFQKEEQYSSKLNELIEKLHQKLHGQVCHKLSSTET